MASALKQTLSYIYILVDLCRLTPESWRNLGVGLGVPMETPHGAHIAPALPPHGWAHGSI
jgi:hypothetical protein